METARHRSNIYGLLSLIYKKEISEYLLHQIKEPALFYVLRNMGADLEDGFLKRPESELLNELAAEYARLFAGTDTHMSPNESVHHKVEDGLWGVLWGKSTIEVKKFIESAGLRHKFEYSGIPDHISVELDFMREVIKEEAIARKEMNTERVNYCLRTEIEFIDHHLSEWIPGFCDKLIEKADISFYREIAKVTKQFIELEKEEISRFLSDSEQDQRTA